MKSQIKIQMDVIGIWLLICLLGVVREGFLRNYGFRRAHGVRHSLGI